MASSKSSRLTPREAKAYELREGNKRLTWPQIGERMGVTKENAAQAHGAAVRKIEKFGIGACVPAGRSLPVLSEEGALDREFKKFIGGAERRHQRAFSGVAGEGLGEGFLDTGA